jgi:hypothetical protein
MGLLSKEMNFTEFQSIIRFVIIISNSEGCGKDDYDNVTLAEDARVYLTNRIKGMANPDYTVDDSHDEETNIDFTNNDDDDTSDSTTAVTSWAYDFYNSCVNEAREARSGEEVNAYYSPETGKQIRSLLIYFPLDSGVMIPFFGYGKINASSSAVEAEFNDIKHRLLKMKLDP